ncbi:GGDEF domain-containing protein [Amycolatopsis pithecellobii]|uniref:Diguanylate cyclase n=1 Tax=Amycolatopsis pithecellobii TaxID=664692 RepID=A0A6N7ZBP1_9PSEU|nr:GGDEF domain-containing protein [Amycolatopsis pithecellobii]MTD59163.1 diguanylate cyclase [Amycolatopsis pithecellobii]
MTEVNTVTPKQVAPDEASLHESIAGALASQGDWRRAYEHLRVALDIERAEPSIPEQLRREVDRLRRERAEAREESLRDALTAVYNRRYLDRRLDDLLADARKPLAVALVDIDLFKNVNDTFGHVIGDQVLRRVAALLREGLPSHAFCARYGGEEFMLVLPAVEPAAAVRVAELARARVADHPWSALRDGLSVTISVGLAYEPGEATANRRQVMEADDLLYAAKHAGRNRVAYRDRAGTRVIEYCP